MASDTGRVLDTLMLPFDEGLLEWPTDGALFLRASHGVALHRRPGLVCEQGFRPDADTLEAAGFAVTGHDPARRYAIVLVLPPRQRDEARALFANAIARTAPGGRVIACVANNAGARSAESDLAAVAGPVSHLGKHKCRVFWTAPLDGPADAALAQAWAELDAPRTIEDGRFVSRPGVFAWARIDAASRLLAAHLPVGLAGDAADLGAGFGYLSAELLERCPGIGTLDVIEAEARALELARLNLERYATRAELRFHWLDATRGLPGRYDVIVSNPPFHAQGRADRPDLGRRFIEVAAESLQPRGRLWLVANRHLPYESALASGFAQVRTVAQEGGFKVIEGVRA
ncbi:class I SAM-dependent methyltransferase [Lysobacter korlensis]|uniref:Class I SAM-dependent methyltransferase n=1 Tax=Lysobacter korlensis TaxID=553636 RepID=A0ABV6RRW0_9GAMM